MTVTFGSSRAGRPVEHDPSKWGSTHTSHIVGEHRSEPFNQPEPQTGGGSDERRPVERLGGGWYRLADGGTEQMSREEAEARGYTDHGGE